MALSDFLAEMDELLAQARQAFSSAAIPEAVEAARIEFLGAKSGRLKALQKGLGGVAPADKPAAGKRFNELKTALEAALAEAQDRIAAAPATADSTPFDPTVPGKRPALGH